MKKYIYKIRNRKTGLFSSGGINPSWNKEGKTWSSPARLKASMRLWSTAMGLGKQRSIPFEWEIVVYQVIENTNISANMLMEIPELKPEDLL